jgi:hypothetical protein
VRTSNPHLSKASSTYSAVSSSKSVELDVVICYTFFGFFLAVLAALTKFAFVGAPFDPTFLIDSPEPEAIRFLFL